VSCCCEKVVAEVGNRGEGEVRRWMPLPSNRSEDVTLDISVCVMVNCKVQSRAVSKSPINPVINANAVYSRSEYT
jgi:hypothetical protein